MEDQSCSELYSALLKAPTVIHDLQQMHSILQLTLLQNIACPSRYIYVANTHLYFHPAADHIRLIQVITCTKALQKAEEEFRGSALAQCPPSPITTHQPDVALVFCGDFNSCPCIGAYQFLTTGSVDSSHLDWTKYKLGLIPRCGCSSVSENEGDFIPSLHLRKLLMDSEGALPVEQSGEALGSWGGHITDGFAGLDVSHPFSLRDACGTHLLLPYTNFTLGFKCVLDYIFVDSNHLTVERVVPLPSLAELTENVALPSVSFPSDHLSLICDLKWKD